MNIDAYSIIAIIIMAVGMIWAFYEENKGLFVYLFLKNLPWQRKIFLFLLSICHIL